MPWISGTFQIIWLKRAFYSQGSLQEEIMLSLLLSFYSIFLSQTQSSRNLHWTCSAYCIFSSFIFLLFPLLEEESTNINLETSLGQMRLYVFIPYSFQIGRPPFTRTCMWDEKTEPHSLIFESWSEIALRQCFVQLKGIGTHLDIKLMKRNDKKESCFCELLFLFRLQPLALAWDTETIFRNKEAEYPSACPSSFSGRNFLIFLF